MGPMGQGAMPSGNKNPFGLGGLSEIDIDQMMKDIAVRESEYKRDLADAEAIMKRAGVTVESLIQDQELNMKFKGKLPKEEQMQTDVDEYHGKW